MKLTVVIPTYNEAENIPSLFSNLLELPLNLRVLIVDDNSPDGTGKLAASLSGQYSRRISVLHRPSKQGLGTAYIQGFQRAMADGAEAVGQMDADFSHPPALLPTLMETLQSCDVVMGSRYVAGGSVDERWPIWRRSLSAFGNGYARFILGMRMKDITGGYRIWRRETLMGLPLEMVRSNGYAFQLEMAYLAHRAGYVCKEIPFYFADRRWGTSKMSGSIQREAAIRVWQILYEYRNLDRVDVRDGNPING